MRRNQHRFKPRVVCIDIEFAALLMDGESAIVEKNRLHRTQAIFNLPIPLRRV